MLPHVIFALIPILSLLPSVAAHGFVTKVLIDGTTYTGFSAYQAGVKQDIHSLYTDPMLQSPNYHAVGRPATSFQLLPGSPARGTGADVCSGISGCSMGTQDFWGYPLPAGIKYNIGAYQGP